MSTWRDRLADRLTDPVFWNGAIQMVKTVVACVGSWVLAESVLDLPQPFLAPWAALLVVHATVYRTFSRGAQQIGATVLGVLAAGLVGHVIGLDAWGLAVVLGIGLVLGTLPWLGAEGTTVSTTALVVLTTGFQEGALTSRLIDTGVGVVVGLVVNLVVWPPLRRRTAFTAVAQLDDTLGELICRIATQLSRVEGEPEDWIECTRDLDEQLDEAWALVRQARESARMNPRRSAKQFRDPQEWYDLLRRTEQAIAETRSMAGTLTRGLLPPDSEFRRSWLGLLTAVGEAIAAADANRLAAVRRDITALGDRLRDQGLSTTWPVEGALLTNLANIADAMSRVAEANPMPAPPLPVPVDKIRPTSA